MNFRRWLTTLLAATMIISTLPTGALAANGNETKREVYLHARGADYQERESYSTVYIGDTAEVYFAVDTPNKGDYISATDSRNDSISSELAEATSGIVEKYENKVKVASQEALSTLKSDIATWYYLSDGSVKDAMKTELEAYEPFLTKQLTQLDDADFDNGALKDTVLKTFDGNSYNTLFNEIYGKNYPYSFTYLYEYEYFYLKKINEAVVKANNSIAEYNQKLAVAEEVDKAALKGALINSLGSSYITFAADDIATLKEADYRVYTRETIHSKRVKSGSDYFVGKDAEELVRHREPYYDLNGYTIKIYYDPDFFELKDTVSPLKYNTPGLNPLYTTDSKDESIDNDTEETPLDDGLWVREMEVIPERDGYAAVAATIFAGGIFFPNKKDGQEWYNLCSLPLVPLKTGSTHVFIERPGADSDFPLTLYAKHDSANSEDFKPTFDLTTVNGGYHTINIRDKVTPSAPEANFASGTYSEKVAVTLTAESDCTIYWKPVADGQQWRIYSYPNQDPATINPIEIDYSQSIVCKAVRTEGVADGEPKPESREVQYDYIIIPESPYLWESQSTIILSALYKDSNFAVYPSHKNDVYNGEIANDRAFYYTFNEDLTAADLPDGTDFAAEEMRDAKTQWRKLTNNNPSITITENVTLRMIARKGNSCSDISVYNLGIRPAPAIDPNYTDGNCTTIDSYTVELTSATTSAEIYYTVNGENPITDGNRYVEPFEITDDTELRTVARIPGTDNYSETKLYRYDFADKAVTAFYPAGIYSGAVNVGLSVIDDPDIVKVMYFVADGGVDSSVTAADARFTDYTNNKIVINKNKTIYAKITYTDGSESDVYTFRYRIKPIKPQFSPASRQFVDSGYVDVSAANISTNEAKYTLYYTTDGSDPTDANNTNRQTFVADEGYLAAAHILVGQPTTIKAVIYADYGEYSDVVTHEYDTVQNKPEKPTMTLAEGSYTLENAHSLQLSTDFAEVPDGVEIYYTVSRNGEAISVPYPGVVGTEHYDGTTPIDVYGNTVIKAVAIDENGVRSDIGTFTYTVIPEMPVAAPSGMVEALNVIPVTTISGATVTYKITGSASEGESTVSFTLPNDLSTFYINPADGLPYREQDCASAPLVNVGSKTFTGSIELGITAKVDGISSPEIKYNYEVSTSAATVVAPYPDKPQGTYDETSSGFVVKLFSQTPGATIYYKNANDNQYSVYDPDSGISLTGFTILKCYAEVGGAESEVKTYVYSFKPLPPVFDYESGTYDHINNVTISLNPASPSGYSYKIYRRYRTVKGTSIYQEYNSSTDEIEIKDTTHLMAYVLNDDTDEVSDIVEKHYIIRKLDDVNPYIEILAPYNVSSVKDSLLSGGEYAKGIKLNMLIGNDSTHYIEYQYSYTLEADNQTYHTSWNRYDPQMPIMVNSGMDNITIKARVVRISNGQKYKEFTHTITLEDDVQSGVIYVSGGGGGGGYVDRTKKYTKDIFGNEHPTHIGYISGYVDGSVRPEGNITREEIVAILYRITNKDYEKPFVKTGEVFPDVTKSRWSATDIEYMFDKGVVSGYPDGEFKPEKNLSRAEFAALVSRFANLELKNMPKNSFADLAENHWAYSNIMAVCEAGLMIGYDDGNFGPDNEITRAEVIVVINKLLGRTPSHPYVKSLAIKPFNDLDKNKWYYVDVLEATVTHNYTLDAKDVEIKWEGYN